MTYALTTDNGATISARRTELPDKVWVADSDTSGHYELLTVANAAGFGWYEIVRNDRPADTSGTIHDLSFVVNGSQIVETWTARAMTVDEQAAYDADQNRIAIDAAISAALTELGQLVNAPAIGAVPDGTMTAAALSTVARELRDAAQQNRVGVQRVAQTLRRTIRLLRNNFDGTD